MEVKLSAHQLRITKVAGEYMGQLCPNPAVQSMFRAHRKSMSMGIIYEEGAQTYIAREVIPWFATRESIQLACHRLVGTLAHTYAKSTATEIMSKLYTDTDTDDACDGK